MHVCLGAVCRLDVIEFFGVITVESTTVEVTTVEGTTSTVASTTSTTAETNLALSCELKLHRHLVQTYTKTSGQGICGYLKGMTEIG